MARILNYAPADQPNIVEVAGRAMELPANLVSPAMKLTRPELERTVLVFERSLVFCASCRPSPLSSYWLLSLEVSIWRNRH